MKKLLLVLLALSLVAPALAEVLYPQTINVTNTSQTIVFAGQRSSISLYNCSDGSTATCGSSNSAYFRLFNCNETAAAATTGNGTPLANGETFQVTYNSVTVSAPYCS